MTITNFVGVWRPPALDVEDGGLMSCQLLRGKDLAIRLAVLWDCRLPDSVPFLKIWEPAVVLLIVFETHFLQVARAFPSYTMPKIGRAIAAGRP